ncbi:extracellular solute-binding protein [Catelliglobosispora koreensis]|uniref:extracellular solute-binding protein n=1 Tax=Catelliglobosispora koreensis TaxID=129052 RepID=UPI00037F9736|nr:extracellular solute-binding protein [Catelliglobosispora koreensis]
MSVSRRNFLAIAGAAALAAACAPSTPAPTTNEDPLKDDGVKDFSFTAWSLNEASTKDVLASLVNNYSTSASAKIATSSYPYNDYLNQVLLQMQGGTLTGAVQVDVAWLATLAATGKLADLSTLAGAADYTPASLGIGKVNGKQYGIPWTSAGIGLIGNKDLLDKAGVSTEPKTIADFETTLRALKGLGNGVVPWAAMTKVDQLKDFIAWMWAFGSPVVKDGKIVVGDDASVEALVWYKKLYDEKLIAPDVNRFDARALFAQGKVGFYEDAIGGKGAVVKAATDKSLADKLLPVSRPVKNASDKPQHLAWGHALVVLQGTGAAAASRFVTALTSSPSYNSEWFAKTGLPPVTKAGLSAAPVKADAFTAAFTGAIGDYVSADPFWIYPKFAQIQSALANGVQSALIGKASPKDALADAKKQMDALTS